MLSELCSLGHTIGHIAKWSSEDLEENLKKLGRLEKVDDNTPSVFAQSHINADESLKSLLLALKHYKLDIISHEFNKLKLVLSPRQLAFDIIQPLMYEVGKSISKGELRLSQEQALMSLIRFHMGSAFYRKVQQKSKKPHALIMTTPEGDYNEMGILISTLLCAHYNLNFYYLGPSLPLNSLVDAATSVNASHIILGTTPSLDTQQLFLDQYIEKLLTKLDKKKSLVLRGNGPFDESKLAQDKRLKNTKSFSELDQYLRSL